MASVSETTAPDPPAAPRSPLEAALERVGDRWSLLLVDALLAGGRRFGELREELRASPRTSSPSGSDDWNARAS